MARPTKLTPTVIADLHARRRRGETLDAIVAATGLANGTVQKGLKLPDPGRGPAKAPAAPPPAPEAAPEAPPEVIPEGAPIADIERWIRWTDELARQAKANGNLAAFSSLVTRLNALSEQRRKLAPPPAADPNENPDMVAARERVREALHKALDRAAERRGR